MAPPDGAARRRRLPRHRPDQRGYGHSSRPTEVDAYGIDQLTADLVGLLDDDRPGPGGVRRPRLGRADRVGAGPPAPRAGAGRGRRERAVRRSGRAADRRCCKMPSTATASSTSSTSSRSGRPRRELEADPRRTMASVLCGASAATASTGVRRRAAADGGHRLPRHPAVSRPTSLPEPWLTRGRPRPLRRRSSRQRASSARSATTATSTPTTSSSRTSPPRGVTMPTCFIGGERRRGRRDGPGRGRARWRRCCPDFRGADVIPGVGHWTQQEAPRRSTTPLLGFLRTL